MLDNIVSLIFRLRGYSVLRTEYFAGDEIFSINIRLLSKKNKSLSVVTARMHDTVSNAVLDECGFKLFMEQTRELSDVLTGSSAKAAAGNNDSAFDFAFFLGRGRGRFMSVRTSGSELDVCRIVFGYGAESQITSTIPTARLKSQILSFIQKMDGRL